MRESAFNVNFAGSPHESSPMNGQTDGCARIDLTARRSQVRAISISCKLPQHVSAVRIPVTNTSVQDPVFVELRTE